MISSVVCDANDVESVLISRPSICGSCTNWI